MKKAFLASILVFSFLLAPFSAMADVSFGNTKMDVTTVSPISFNNNGNYLIVSISSTVNNISSVTYPVGGVATAMSQIGTAQYHSNYQRYVSVWGLTNPDQGSNNITITGGANSYVNIVSVLGVDQSAPYTGLTTKTGNSATPAITATTTASNAYVFAVGVIQSGASAGANTTLVLNTSGAELYSFRSTGVANSTAATIAINSTSGEYVLKAFGINPDITMQSPTQLQVESQTNPTSVATSNPRFSAVVTSASTTILATSYQLQVATSSTYWGAPYWDSGRKTLSSSTPANQRTPQIYSTTTFPQNGSTYYWRIALFDQSGFGNWSTVTSLFTMNTPPQSYPSTILQDLTYAYDAVGNITSITDRSGTNGVGSTTYSYDNLYRLIGATSSQSYNNYTQTYTYDILGNLTNKSDIGNYTYAGTGYANPDAATTIGGVNYGYDNSGNLLTYGSTTNTWNYRDRLIATNDGKGASATTTAYRYDENDQRVAQDVKNGAGATTTTTYFSNLFERTGSATTTLYIYAAGQLIATIEGNGVSTSTYVTHTDHLGSSNVQSDKNGNLAQLTQYYPFGSMIQNQQPTSGYNIKKKFLNQAYDDAISQSYLNARFLQNNNGRFTSLDPVSRDVGMMGKMPPYILAMSGNPAEIDQNALLANPQMLNLYSYSVNNPINKSDPSGKIAAVAALPFAPAAMEAIAATGPLAGGLAVGGVAVGAVGVGGYYFGWYLAAGVDGLINYYKQGGDFSPKTKEEAREKAGSECVYCGQPTTPAEKSKKGVPPPPNEGQTDHYNPKSKGGSNDPSNAEHACRTCNNEKSNTPPQGTKWELPGKSSPPTAPAAGTGKKP